VKAVTTYVANDGKEFPTQAEAEKHEAEMEKKNAERYLKFIQGYRGKRLLAEHSTTEEGIWKVTGEEDDAVPFGGNSGANMGLFQGRLIDVIHHVTAKNRFWTWGGGGDIQKVSVKKLNPPT
jgi:hypothetical protein